MPNKTSIKTAKIYLESLDLTYIVDYMCSANYTLPRWTRDDAKTCMRLYKNYLLLNIIYPNEALVPTREIDEFWHNHILHTKKYFNDCKNIFGVYLHHVPNDPLEEVELLIQQYANTKELYFNEFNEQLNLIKP